MNDDVLVTIFSLLEVHDYCNSSLTCTKFYNRLHETVEELFERTYYRCCFIAFRFAVSKHQYKKAKKLITIFDSSGNPEFRVRELGLEGFLLLNEYQEFCGCGQDIKAIYYFISVHDLTKYIEYLIKSRGGHYVSENILNYMPIPKHACRYTVRNFAIACTMLLEYSSLLFLHYQQGKLLDMLAPPSVEYAKYYYQLQKQFLIDAIRKVHKQIEIKMLE
jgi:hypothetical protein